MDTNAIHDRLAGVAAALGFPWAVHQTAQMERYAAWLEAEGVRLGGIGPDEPDRLWDRHLIDSVVFAAGIDADSSVLDVGTGVGLPGIPLAIALPESDITLLDRSGRRVDALHRISTILGLGAAVVESEVGTWHRTYDRVVLRASLTLPEVFRQIPRLVADRGEIRFGLGRGSSSAAVSAWLRDPPPPPEGWTAKLWSSPDGVLDSPSWMLRIGRW